HELQFLQIAFLGINLFPNQLPFIRPNWEGGIVKIEFDKLEIEMKKSEKWTPSGWLHILYWLYMNCPNSSSLLTFKGKSPRQLANDLLVVMKKFKPARNNKN